MISLPSIHIGQLSKLTSGMGTSKVVKIGVPVAAILIAVAVLVGVVWPVFGKVVNLRISNKQLVERVKGLEGKLSALQSLDRDVLDRQLGASEQMLPSDKGVFSVVSQIENEASKSGVILGRVDVAPGSIGASLLPAQSATAQTAAGGTTKPPTEAEAAKAETPFVEIKLSLTSDYQSLLRFISALNSLPRVVTIPGIVVVADSTTGAIRSQMSVDAYWKPLPAELPPVEAPIVLLTEDEERILAGVKEIEFAASGAVTGGGVAAGPTVPTGKSDIFAPF